MTRAGTVPVGLAAIDAISPQEAVCRVADQVLAAPGTCLVVTPNIDHIVRLESDAAFRAAYERADLVFADGWPVVLAARLHGAKGARRVTGSDLVTSLSAEAARRGLGVAFVGGAPGAAQGAASTLREAYPTLKVVAVEPAPRSQIDDPPGVAFLRQRLADSRADIVFLALGTPRQEVFAQQHLMDLGLGAVVCIGAGLDFLSGAQRRAPYLWRKVGLEWLYRLLREPRRLGPRYVAAAPRFLLLMLRGRR